MWDPAWLGDNLFAVNPVTPLGVAHRREWWEKVGGFNEMLWREEDWDFWKRLARAGAEFVFLPLRSGRYHVRPDSLSRVPRPTARQREAVEANWRAHRPIFTPSKESKSQIAGFKSATPNPRSKIRNQKSTIAFASTFCLFDFTSGAAVAARQALRFLESLGFPCRAFCGSRLDTGQEVCLEDVLARQGVPLKTRTLDLAGYRARLLLAPWGKTGSGDVTIFRMQSTAGRWAGNEEQTAFYMAYGRFLDECRPDALLVYGGDPVADTIIRLAKNRDIPVVFCLHNFSYRDARAFTSVDYVVVPSEFSRDYHWRELGLACHCLPNVIDWERVQVTDGDVRDGKMVTFVNPQPTKGLFVFARIAEALSRRRPDIPLLVVEGRSRNGWRRETGIDLERLPNFHVMPSTGDPREFYRATKLVLMPSLWNESFGLVAAEAMLNGIPVLASNRGALPETVGDAGFLFDIPACYTPRTCTLPAVEEVEPWVETIIRLWDDAEAYGRANEAARRRAQRWRPERLAETYREFFGNLSPQPGPPVVPSEARPDWSSTTASNFAHHIPPCP